MQRLTKYTKNKLCIKLVFFKQLIIGFCIYAILCNKQWFLTSLARNAPRSSEEGELKNKQFGMMSLKQQGSLNLRLQKVISKETTTGTVIVTGSAKPIFCIRIRQANFPGTRDMQCVSAGYTDCGDILLQINYARHIPALEIP